MAGCAASAGAAARLIAPTATAAPAMPSPARFFRLSRREILLSVITNPSMSDAESLRTKKFYHYLRPSICDEAPLLLSSAVHLGTTAATGWRIDRWCDPTHVEPFAPARQQS